MSVNPLSSRRLSYAPPPGLFVAGLPRRLSVADVGELYGRLAAASPTFEALPRAFVLSLSVSGAGGLVAHEAFGDQALVRRIMSEFQGAEAGNESAGATLQTAWGRLRLRLSREAARPLAAPQEEEEDGTVAAVAGEVVVGDVRIELARSSRQRRDALPSPVAAAVTAVRVPPSPSVAEPQPTPARRRQHGAVERPSLITPTGPVPLSVVGRLQPGLLYEGQRRPSMSSPLAALSADEAELNLERWASSVVEQCLVFEADEAGVLRQPECKVCADSIVVGASLLRLPCMHLVHMDCAKTWFRSDLASRGTARCPICNVDVRSMSGRRF
jgi:hypothetical protein